MDRLYAGGSSIDGGTLLQLRNLINRRNVAKDVTGRFNACIDYMETVIHCHITAAAMDFFGMKEQTDDPSSNALPLCDGSMDASQKWNVLQGTVGEIVNRYVVLQDFVNINTPGHASQ